MCEERVLKSLQHEDKVQTREGQGNGQDQGGKWKARETAIRNHEGWRGMEKKRGFQKRVEGAER